MIEVEVHSSLLAFLRAQRDPQWPHHLTMARLIARAFRLNRSGVIQTGSTWKHYCLSYLTPALLWQGGVILVVPKPIQSSLVEQILPQLQQWLKTHKEIRVDDGQKFHEQVKSSFLGIFITSPQNWLKAHLDPSESLLGIPTLIDQASNLESWTREYLTCHWQGRDWNQLMQRYPAEENSIRNLRVQLTKTIFDHPPNPYECYLLEPSDRQELKDLLKNIQPLDFPWKNIQQLLEENRSLIWASVQRDTGQFTLNFAPIAVDSYLSQIWKRQTVVLMGGFLDEDTQALVYRKQLGLGDVTCLKFTPNRQNDSLKLYLPPRFPLPNTAEFRPALLQHLKILVNLSRQFAKLMVLLVDDMPLKAQVGTAMAAEFGSQVKVEKIPIEPQGILVSGWNFWHQHQYELPTPHLLVIATLPLPSLENPLVAARVANYKHQRQNWFNLYLLPTALGQLQQAVMPLRESQGMVAVLDNRVAYRSYGKRILKALEPFARINYIDASWFEK